MKILVAIDGSTFTKKMLAYLAAHDEWLGDHHEYTLLHVVYRLPGRATAVLDPETLKAYYAETADKVFKPIKSFFSKNKLQADFQMKVGSPADELILAAKRGKFDLLMMGSHGHGSLTNLVMGSVATKVLAGCQTPTLLIR